MKFLQIIANLNSEPCSFRPCESLGQLQRLESEWANLSIPYPYRQPGQAVIGGIEFVLIGWPADQVAFQFVEQFAPLLDEIWHKFSDHIFEIV